MTSSSSLMDAFSVHPLGLCGKRETAGQVSTIDDLEQRLNIVTLGVVLASHSPIVDVWTALCAVHTHWLLIPSKVAYLPSAQIGATLRELNIPAPQHMGRVWWQICRGVQGRFKGSWRDLLQANDNDALVLQKFLRTSRTTFPILSGPAISVRWLDLINRIGNVKLKNWDQLSVKLPSSQRQLALLFGVDAETAHPLFVSALEAWASSCEQKTEDVCGLANCPRRKD